MKIYKVVNELMVSMVNNKDFDNVPVGSIRTIFETVLESNGLLEGYEAYFKEISTSDDYPNAFEDSVISNS
jgi:hypothetical protein